MEKDFLITTSLGKQLYDEVAALPIIDFHNHLCVEDIKEDLQFQNIAKLWLISDPYKHRAMRICGIEERRITGDASDKEKFEAWCCVFPKLIGNPLYYWSIMEMEDLFGIQEPICAENADIIWEKANQKLKEPDFSAQSLLKRFNVEYNAPCTKLNDDLSIFNNLTGTVPSLRGDDMIAPTEEWIKELKTSSGCSVDSYKEYLEAVKTRLDAFAEAGCSVSDHALDDGFYYLEADGKEEQRFQRLLECGELQEEEKYAWISDMLRFLGEEYARRGWVMQLHMRAHRFTSTRLRKLAGPAGGFAGIGHESYLYFVIQLLDDLEQSEHGLPRTILFPLNPADNEAISTLSGSFSEDGVAGKVSQGPAWWWSDHLSGMKAVLDSVSSYSVISTFLGMTTDSRSILSFIRHDYFRRVLCSWIGEKVQAGEFPDDYESLKELAEAICYKNIKNIIKKGE